MRVDKAGELCFIGLSLELFVPTRSSWMARPYQGCIEIEEPPGSRRVKRTLQTGSCLASLCGFGGGQCVPVGHPLDQAGWDRLALNGSQSAWLILFFSFFFKLPPVEPS